MQEIAKENVGEHFDWMMSCAQQSQKPIENGMPL